MSTTISGDIGMTEAPDVDTPAESTTTTTSYSRTTTESVSHSDTIGEHSLILQPPAQHDINANWNCENVDHIERLQASREEYTASSRALDHLDPIPDSVDMRHELQDEETQPADQADEVEDQEEGQTEDREQLQPAPDAMDLDQASMALIQQMLNDDLDAFNLPPLPQNVPQPQAANHAAPAPQAAGDDQVPADGAVQGDDDEDSESDDDGDGDGIQQAALDPNDPTAHFLMVNRGDANHESIACPACESVVQDNELVYLTCGHVWCSDCLNNNLRAALSARTMFPPRCCIATPNGIDMTVVEGYLEDDVLIRYLNVGEEYASSDPTFCSDVKCGVFINVPTDNTSQWASCAKCHKSTCIQCKGAYLDHPTPDVHPELISREDKELAEREGYKQCPNSKCRKLLERIDGCDHMTCDCGNHFCYRCGRSLNYGSVDGMACNCQGQNQWIDSVQQWQNGGGDREEDDDESDEDGDEEDEDEVIHEMGVAPADVPPAFDDINHALAVAVNAVRDRALANDNGEQVPMPAAFEEAIHLLQAHYSEARVGLGAGEAAAARDLVNVARDFDNILRDQVMSDAPAPEAEQQQYQHEEQNEEGGDDQRTADAGGNGGW